MKTLATFILVALCASAALAQTPSVTTTYRSRDITQTSATVGGSITYSGNSDDIIRRGVVWDTNPNPKVSDFRIRKGSGTGNYWCDLTGLQPNTTYYARAYAVTDNGRTYGNQIVFTTLADPVFGTVTDIDANTYTTVIIGSQEWMMENLKVTRYSNGDPIQHVTNNATWFNINTATDKGAYCNYDNDASNVPTYGRLYNWYAATDARNIAPAGFRVPSRDDWNEMELYLGSTGSGSTVNGIGRKLKEIGTIHWTSPNDATNISGFTALPAGYRSQGGSYLQRGDRARLWSTSLSGGWAFYRELYYSSDDIVFVIASPNKDNYRLLGLSVRCMRDIQKISASSGPGGTISPTGLVIVGEGENKSFTFTPDPGYEIASVKVNGVPVPNPQSTYTFTNVISDQSIAVEFAPLPGSIEGVLTSGSSGLSGVTVKLLDGNGNPLPGFDPVLSGSNGQYEFSPLPPAAYQIMLVEPFGYTIDQNPKAVTVLPATVHTLDFSLTPVATSNDARGRGYWKHQYDVHVTSQGQAQETASQLADYITAVHAHYTPRFDLFAGVASFQQWQTALTGVNPQPMHGKAKRELAALLMNFFSLKIGPVSVVTLDGRTAADVMTYVSVLLTDNNSGNDALAKDLAERVNNQVMIGAGIVPAGNIVYKGSASGRESGRHVPDFSLSRNFPNPFNPSTTIQYSIPESAEVTLRVFDASGRIVAELVNGAKAAGSYAVTFDASSLASGVYFYRLEVEGRVLTHSMTLQK
ncbi:MAG: T9SS type A sorting domain-containing protein [Bacteroidia bacterium]|nr:T9SS type A sorting domain-containing protein [Bacteroidia bacterium]